MSRTGYSPFWRPPSSSSGGRAFSGAKVFNFFNQILSANTDVTAFDTVIYDDATYWDGSKYFVAPATGRYRLTFSLLVTISFPTTEANFVEFFLTGNGTVNDPSNNYSDARIYPGTLGSPSVPEYTLHTSSVYDMDAAATFGVRIGTVSIGSATATLLGGSTFEFERLT